MSRNDYIKEWLEINRDGKHGHNNKVNIISNDGVDWLELGELEFTDDNLLSHEWEEYAVYSIFEVYHCKCGFYLGLGYEGHSTYINISSHKRFTKKSEARDVSCIFSEEDSICHDVIT
jgi:hypothetical protein